MNLNYLVRSVLQDIVDVKTPSSIYSILL